MDQEWKKYYLGKKNNFGSHNCPNSFSRKGPTVGHSPNTKKLFFKLLVVLSTPKIITKLHKPTPNTMDYYR